MLFIIKALSHMPVLSELGKMYWYKYFLLAFFFIIKNGNGNGNGNFIYIALFTTTRVDQCALQ